MDQASLVVQTVKNLQFRRTGLDPWDGRSPGEGNGYPLQYSFLENSMDKGVWWAIALGVSESETWKLTLSLSLHFRAMEDGFIF